MTHTRCVVFDLDDTLYMESSYVRSGFEAVGSWVAEHLGIVGFAEAAWNEHLLGNRGNIFDRVLLANGRQPSDGVIGSLVSVYRKHIPRISLLPDARQCLESLKDKVFLGVITDGPREAQRAKVVALKLPELVDEVVITDEWGRDYWKPHPRAFQMLQEQSGVETTQSCFHIGDNPDKDFITARQLGWKTIRIRRIGGFHCSKEAPPEMCADVEVTDLAQVPTMVLGG